MKKDFISDSIRKAGEEMAKDYDNMIAQAITKVKARGYNPKMLYLKVEPRKVIQNEGYFTVRTSFKVAIKAEKFNPSRRVQEEETICV